MKIECAFCHSVMALDENKYDKENLLIQCPKCNQKLRVVLPKKRQILSTNQTEKMGVFKDANNIHTSDMSKQPSVERNISIISVILLVLLMICGLYSIYDLSAN